MITILKACRSTEIAVGPESFGTFQSISEISRELYDDRVQSAASWMTKPWAPGNQATNLCCNGAHYQCSSARH